MGVRYTQEKIGTRERMRSGVNRIINEAKDDEGENDKREEIWGKWRGKGFKELYTDGSYKPLHTVRSLLLGGSKVKAGGAVILERDGRYAPIFIEMDVKIENAFQTEAISIIAGCLIMGKTDELTLHSDCLGAMAAVEGKNKDVGRVIGNWRPQKNIRIKKVKAHPERREGSWTKEDKGIYMADKVAGGEGVNIDIIKASAVMGRVAKDQVISIVDEKGVPFFGNLRRRNSKEKKKRYLKKRDDYREKDGKLRIWEGTSLHLSHKMMGRNKTIEDRKRSWNGIKSGF